MKFCTQAGYIKSQHMDDISPLKEAWSGSHVTFLLYCTPYDISGLAEARAVKFCSQVACIIFQPKDDKPPLKDFGQCYMPVIQFWCSQSYLWNGWSDSCQILYAGRIYQVLGFRWQI